MNKLLKVASMFQRKLADESPDTEREPVSAKPAMNEQDTLVTFMKDKRVTDIRLAHTTYHYDPDTDVVWSELSEFPRDAHMPDRISEYINWYEEWEPEPETERAPAPGQEGPSSDPRWRNEYQEGLALTPLDGRVLFRLIDNMIANDILTKDLEYYSGLLKRLQALQGEEAPEAPEEPEG
jgi:hypothetical protein